MLRLTHIINNEEVILQRNLAVKDRFRASVVPPGTESFPYAELVEYWNLNTNKYIEFVLVICLDNFPRLCPGIDVMLF